MQKGQNLQKGSQGLDRKRSSEVRRGGLGSNQSCVFGDFGSSTIYLLPVGLGSLAMGIILKDCRIDDETGSLGVEPSSNGILREQGPSSESQRCST